MKIYLFSRNVLAKLVREFEFPILYYSKEIGGTTTTNQLFVDGLYNNHHGRHQHGEASLDLCVNLKLRS